MAPLPHATALLVIDVQKGFTTVSAKDAVLAMSGA
jgi:nicotinamidase-related amidase